MSTTSTYRPRRARSAEPRSRFLPRSRSCSWTPALTTANTPITSGRTYSAIAARQYPTGTAPQTITLVRRPPRYTSTIYDDESRTTAPRDTMAINKADPYFWYNYYGRIPDWMREYRTYYSDSPYTQLWYDPNSYRRTARTRPEPYLDRTDADYWRLILDPYYDNRNLWRSAQRSRQYRAADTALALKLYYDRLLTYDDLQRNWLAKRSSWWSSKKSNCDVAGHKRWWNEVGLTHRYVPSTYRFPARRFYSFDY